MPGNIQKVGGKFIQSVWRGWQRCNPSTQRDVLSCLPILNDVLFTQLPSRYRTPWEPQNPLFLPLASPLDYWQWHHPQHTSGSTFWHPWWRESSVATQGLEETMESFDFSLNLEQLMSLCDKMYTYKENSQFSPFCYLFIWKTIFTAKTTFAKLKGRDLIFSC